MSRNQPIPGRETICLSQSLQALANDPADLAATDAGTPSKMACRAIGWPGRTGCSIRNLSRIAGQVICVNGGQHGLLCALMALLKAGDTLVTEHLTYPGLIGVARQLGIKLIGVAMDAEGLFALSVG